MLRKYFLQIFKQGSIGHDSIELTKSIHNLTLKQVLCITHELKLRKVMHHVRREQDGSFVMGWTN